MLHGDERVRYAEYRWAAHIEPLSAANFRFNGLAPEPQGLEGVGEITAGGLECWPIHGLPAGTPAAGRRISRPEVL